jgi:hypothetical protein
VSWTEYRHNGVAPTVWFVLLAGFFLFGVWSSIDERRSTGRRAAWWRPVLAGLAGTGVVGAVCMWALIVRIDHYRDDVAAARRVGPSVATGYGAGGRRSLPGSTPTALCRDGTTSYSANHRGTCSHHGGVAQWLDGDAGTVSQPYQLPTDPVVVSIPSPVLPTPDPVGTQLTPVQLPAAAVDPHSNDVAVLLGRYFSDINIARYADAFSLLTPALQRTLGSEQEFADGESTSLISDVTITNISALDTSSVITVDVTFRSTQDANHGPRPGEVCTDWSLEYELMETDAVLLIDHARSAGSEACG